MNIGGQAVGLNYNSIADWPGQVRPEKSLLERLRTDGGSGSSRRGAGKQIYEGIN